MNDDGEEGEEEEEDDEMKDEIKDEINHLKVTGLLHFVTAVNCHFLCIAMSIMIKFRLLNLISMRIYPQSSSEQQSIFKQTKPIPALGSAAILYW